MPESFQPVNPVLCHRQSFSLYTTCLGARELPACQPCSLSLAGAATSVIFVMTKKKFMTKICSPQQNFRHNKIMFVVTKCFCFNTTFVMTNICTCLSRQFFCRDKHAFVATKHVFCHNKHVFVATKVSLS